MVIIAMSHIFTARQGGDGEADSLKQLMTEGRAGEDIAGDLTFFRWWNT